MMMTRLVEPYSLRQRKYGPFVRLLAILLNYASGGHRTFNLRDYAYVLFTESNPPILTICSP